MWNAAVNLHNYMRICRKLGQTAVLLCLTFLSAGCQNVEPVVKVALVAPFEGRHRDVGYDVLYSARLAVRELNAAGGIDGTLVSLVTLDDGGNPEFAVATADSLIVDPAVVAVVGHWLPETTDAAEPQYAGSGVAFIAGGAAPFQAVDPHTLSPAFVDSYTAVTPFDEMPGPYAWPAYDAYLSLWLVLQRSQDEYGAITRATVQKALGEAE